MMLSANLGNFISPLTGQHLNRAEWSFDAVTESKIHAFYGFKAFNATPIYQNQRRCQCLDLHKELIPYKKAHMWQKAIVERRHNLIQRSEDHSDVLIFLQHPPVFTLGTGSSEGYLKFEIQNAPYDIHRTERGGEVTYHGPGQLIMYPLLNLRYHKMDLHWYLRSLEEIVIRVLRKRFSIKASRIKGLTGVWVGNQKVAAIGIKVSRWVTYHGLALNVTTDLTPFQHIVPCGIRDLQVGSIGELLCIPSGGEANLIDVTCKALFEEFSDVFQLSLHLKSLTDLAIDGVQPNVAFE